MFVLVGSLATADLLAGCGLILHFVFQYVVPSETVSLLTVGFLVASFAASVSSLLAITVDRYLSLYNALTYYSRRTLLGVHLLLAATWTVSLGLGLLPVLGWNCLAEHPFRRGLWAPGRSKLRKGRNFAFSTTDSVSAAKLPGDVLVAPPQPERDSPRMTLLAGALGANPAAMNASAASLNDSQVVVVAAEGAAAAATLPHRLTQLSKRQLTLWTQPPLRRVAAPLVKEEMEKEKPRGEGVLKPSLAVAASRSPDAPDRLCKSRTFPSMRNPKGHQLETQRSLSSLTGSKQDQSLLTAADTCDLIKRWSCSCCSKTTQSLPDSEGSPDCELNLTLHKGPEAPHSKALPGCGPQEASRRNYKEPPAVFLTTRSSRAQTTLLISCRGSKMTVRALKPVITLSSPWDLEPAANSLTSG
ncbi:PREDICTED: G-protein coupled receptor 6 [Mandrillus leucophaeus]|uniref:G-protein coupled receptor 6 n=1 Tax=Mandrillus leucophaeus TaxID=9568 RepID=UPI0005F4B930|nr:PREDICTED: G-protein coupled receptor 6 [Mandrillus leucophaeus]